MRLELLVGLQLEAPQEVVLERVLMLHFELIAQEEAAEQVEGEDALVTAKPGLEEHAIE